MDGYTLGLLKDTCNYYKQNQPTPVTWEVYRVGDINTFVFDPELCEIVKGSGIAVSSSEQIEVIRIIFNIRFRMYNVYIQYMRHIHGKLIKLNNWYCSGKNLRFIRSHIRIVKQSNKIALQCYCDIVHLFNNNVEQVLSSRIKKKILNLEKTLLNILCILGKNLKESLSYRYAVPGWDIGILDGVTVNIDNIYATYFVHRSLRYIIPTTDITVFEFLFMDLNLTHLPILNHEELMVEEFKELEHLIRGRCKKLKEIYDTHLILNEKHSNFPEDCTNHILKYCQENYTLQPSGTRFDVVMWIKF